MITRIFNIVANNNLGATTGPFDILYKNEGEPETIATIAGTVDPASNQLKATLEAGIDIEVEDGQFLEEIIVRNNSSSNCTSFFKVVPQQAPEAPAISEAFVYNSNVNEVEVLFQGNSTVGVELEVRVDSTINPENWISAGFKYDLSEFSNKKVWDLTGLTYESPTRIRLRGISPDGVTASDWTNQFTAGRQVSNPSFAQQGNTLDLEATWTRPTGYTTHNVTVQWYRNGVLDKTESFADSDPSVAQYTATSSGDSIYVRFLMSSPSVPQIIGPWLELPLIEVNITAPSYYSFTVNEGSDFSEACSRMTGGSWTKTLYGSNSTFRNNNTFFTDTTLTNVYTGRIYIAHASGTPKRVLLVDSSGKVFDQGTCS